MSDVYGAGYREHITFVFDNQRQYTQPINIPSTFQYIQFINVTWTCLVHLGSSPGEPFGYIQQGDSGIVRLPGKVDNILLETINIPVGINPAAEAYLTDTPIRFDVVHPRPPFYVENSTIGDPFQRVTFPPQTPLTISEVYMSPGVPWETYQQAINTWGPGGVLDGIGAVGLFAKQGAGIIPVVADVNGNLGVSINNVLPLPVTKSPYATYTAIGKSAANPGASLSHVYAGAGSFEFLTIFHTNTSVKTVQILGVEVAVESISAAVRVAWYCAALVNPAPATGNPNIGARQHDSQDPNNECTILALPTTQGSESSAIYGYGAYIDGITGAVPTVNPPANLPWIPLIGPQNDLTYKPITLEAGHNIGMCVACYAGGAVTVNAFVRVVFTEN